MTEQSEQATVQEPDHQRRVDASSGMGGAVFFSILGALEVYHDDERVQVNGPRTTIDGELRVQRCPCLRRLHLIHHRHGFRDE